MNIKEGQMAGGPKGRRPRYAARRTQPSVNKKTSETDNASKLLSIPVELRYEIYKHLLTDVDKQSLVGKRWLHGSILRVCKELRSEAYHFLCTNNKWLRMTFYHDSYMSILNETRPAFFVSTQPLLQNRVCIPETDLPSSIVSVLEKKVDVEFQVPRGGHLSRAATIPKSFFMPYNEVIWVDICKAITTETMPPERRGDDKIIIAPGARYVLRNESMPDYQMILPLALLPEGRTTILLDQWQSLSKLRPVEYSFQSRLDQVHNIQELLLSLCEIGDAYASQKDLPIAITYYKFGLDYVKHYEMQPCNEFTQHGTPQCNGLIWIRNELIIRLMQTINGHLDRMLGSDKLAFAQIVVDLLDDVLLCGELVHTAPTSSDLQRYQYHSCRADSLLMLRRALTQPPIGFDTSTLRKRVLKAFGGSSYPTYTQLTLAEAKDCRWASTLAEDANLVQYWMRRFLQILSELRMDEAMFEAINPTYRCKLLHREKEWQHDAEMVGFWHAMIPGVECIFAAGEYNRDFHYHTTEEVEKLVEGTGIEGEVNLALAKLLLCQV